MKISYWAEAISWELLGLVVFYMLTGSLKHGLIYVLVRTVMYVFHKKAWKRLRRWWFVERLK